MVNKGTSAPRGQTVKHVNIKRVVIAILLATAGLVVFTLAAEHTYQEKQRQQLNQTLQEKVELQKVLERNKLDSEKNQQEIERLKKELQAKRDGQARALAEAHKAPVKRVQAPQGVVGCGDNVYKQFIYKHESGCRTNARNSIGCVGLGQACPGSKLPCSLDDWACQDAWFSNYAIKRYGSWENAYNFWVAHRWW